MEKSQSSEIRNGKSKKVLFSVPDDYERIPVHSINTHKHSQDRTEKLEWFWTTAGSHPGPISKRPGVLSSIKAIVY